MRHNGLVFLADILAEHRAPLLQNERHQWRHFVRMQGQLCFILKQSGFDFSGQNPRFSFTRPRWQISGVQRCI
jgi:hypothetical protein